MSEDELDRLLHDARDTYHAPVPPPLEAMWEEVERAHFGAGAPLTRRRALSFRAASMAAAAALVIGVGIGWVAARGTWRDPSGVGTHIADVGPSRAELAPLIAPADVPVAATASQYLGQTAALLAAVRREADGAPVDGHFVAQATDLLATTRLLLDSRAALDPELQSLLEDLELVLAQIARLPERGHAPQARQELQLIARALEQRDVVPRLRSAAAGLAADLPNSSSDD